MSVFNRFRDQGPKTIPNGPPMRADTRADPADMRRMTGTSGPVGGPYGQKATYTKQGDHRQPGLHSDARTSSEPPRTRADHTPVVIGSGRK
jgi:hypothetical protein